MHLNHPEITPLSTRRGPWKNCLPQNWSLVTKIWGLLTYTVEAPTACSWSHLILAPIQGFGNGDPTPVVEVSILGVGENSQYM